MMLFIPKPIKLTSLSLAHAGAIHLLRFYFLGELLLFIVVRLVNLCVSRCDIHTNEKMCSDTLKKQQEGGGGGEVRFPFLIDWLKS